jgi:hypothetical protein
MCRCGIAALHSQRPEGDATVVLARVREFSVQWWIGVVWREEGVDGLEVHGAVELSGVGLWTRGVDSRVVLWSVV